MNRRLSLVISLLAVLLAQCGDDPGTAVDGETPENRLPPKALLVGACDILRLASEPEMCTGVEELLACSTEHCNLDACAATCQGELSCALATGDHCMAIASCPRSSDCADCMTQLIVCSHVTHCGGRVRCAWPAQSGTCKRLEACCMTQQMPAGCLGWAQAMGGLSGDSGCDMLLANPKFVEAYASDPRCELEN